MSIAKSVVTGIVYRAPEKRFTQNDVAVSSFVLNIGEREELFVRIISKRNVLDEVVSTIVKGDRVLVEGRLQTNLIKTETGAEKRIFEIDANSIEKLTGSSAAVAANTNFGTEEIVSFESDNFSNELIGEDEIPF
jgi:single-strand DNA-binding protein